MSPNNKLAPSMASREKQDPGFVKLRRGLGEHLGRMSGNATKLYIWLLIRAEWKGPRRGCVVASFADVGQALTFGSKTLQRACEELECGEKPFVSVQRAANQYGLTRIKILRYELSDGTSGVDKSDHTNSSAVDTAMDKYDHSDVHSNHPNSLKQRLLQAPKNLEEVKKGREDAVRRRFDAELHPSDENLASKAKPKTSFEAKSNAIPRTAKLRSRIAALIKRNDETYADWIDREVSKGRPNPFGREEREAFAALGYEPNLRSPDLSSDFVNAVCNVHEEHRGTGVSPGNLCSKVIDRLQRDRSSDRRQGGDGCGHFWPNDFQRHRDTLRERERLAESAAKAKVNTPSCLSKAEAQRSRPRWAVPYRNAVNSGEPIELNPSRSVVLEV